MLCSIEHIDTNPPSKVILPSQYTLAIRLINTPSFSPLVYSSLFFISHLISSHLFTYLSLHTFIYLPLPSFVLSLFISTSIMSTTLMPTIPYHTIPYPTSLIPYHSTIPLYHRGDTIRRGIRHTYRRLQASFHPLSPLRRISLQFVDVYSREGTFDLPTYLPTNIYPPITHPPHTHIPYHPASLYHTHTDTYSTTLPNLTFTTPLFFNLIVLPSCNYSVPRMKEPVIPNQPPLHLVHRLDRVTSGLVVIAKSKEAAQQVSQEIRDKSTRKTYLARVQGTFPARLHEVVDGNNTSHSHTILSKTVEKTSSTTSSQHIHNNMLT